MKLGLIAIAALLIACPTKPPVPPGPPPPDDGSGTCAGWCAHATELRCEAAKPTPRGASCVTVCTNMQSSGIASWNLQCRTGAKTCAAAEECERGK